MTGILTFIMNDHVKFVLIKAKILSIIYNIGALFTNPEQYRSNQILSNNDQLLIRFFAELQFTVKNYFIWFSDQILD